MEEEFAPDLTIDEAPCDDASVGTAVGNLPNMAGGSVLVLPKTVVRAFSMNG